MAKLTIKDDSGRERSYILSTELTMAGRASTNGIQINDEKSSRQHFKIEKREGAYFAADLDSTNGTKLNGTRLALPTQLRTGDVLSVGKTTLVFEEGEDTGAALVAIDSTEPEVSPEDALRATMVEPAKKIIESKPAKAEGGPVYILKVMEGALPGKTFELGNEPLTIGRHPSNTVQIDDEAASNYHSEIAREPVGYVVADLGSTNGTRVRKDCDAEFEKVVKTPLKPGMQIRIGKTLLEFQNVGEAVPEDSIPTNLGALQPQQLGAQLEAAGGGGGEGLGTVVKIVLGVAALAIFGAGGWLVLQFIKRGSTDGPPKVVIPEVQKTYPNLIPNGNFDQDIDDAGDPKEFTISKPPGVIVSITAEADHQSDKPEAQRHGLQISKSGATKLDKPTIVETRDPIPVDPNKSYEISGWMRNDDDGIFGMRIVWIDGERSWAEDPIVVKGTPGWGKAPRTEVRTPPAWASRARVGVFVQGKSGKTYFDDLVFREKPGPVVPRPAPVKNAGISLQFEGQNGSFSVSSQGKNVLEDGTLILESPELKASTDLSSAFKPAVNKGDEPNSMACAGSIFDFAQQVLANYSVTAKPGASGVNLSATISVDAESTSKPSMRFYITGPAALGEIEITKTDGTVSRLLPTEAKTDTGIKNILFNAGKAPQFNLGLAKTAEVSLKLVGKRRLVEIRFTDAIELSMAPEDLAQKQDMLAMSADMNKSVQAKDWGAAQTKMKALVEKYGTRFAQAQEDANKARESIDASWKAAQDELKQFLDTIQKAPTPEILEKANQALLRQTEAWKNSEQAQQLADIGDQIKAIKGKYMNIEDEKKAEEAYAKAMKYFENGSWEVAIAIWQKSIIEDKDLGKTKAAEKAKEMIPKAEEAQKEKKYIDGITDYLRGVVKVQLAAKDYAGAITAIEKEPEYKANRAKLKEVQEWLDDWHKKSGK